MEKLILKDNSSRNFVVDDPKRFQKHLLEFHVCNGEADNSVHEENGFYFTVTEDLFNKVENFVLNYKI